VMRTGADRARSRLRSSDSKPFITDRITISAATPTPTPASDTQVMKETKYRCARARAYRRPTYRGSGWNIRSPACKHGGARLATQFTKLAREGTRPDRLRGALLYSTAMRTALALTLALVALPLSAETLVVDGQVQVRPVSIELPRRGSSMAQVEARFGAPRTRHAAVGQ